MVSFNWFLESAIGNYNNQQTPSFSSAPIKRERDMSGGDYTEHDFSQPPTKRASDFSRASLTSLAQSNLNEILAAAAASNGIASVKRHPFHHTEDDEREQDQERDADMEEGDEEEEEAARREAVNKLRATDSLHHLSNVAMMNHAKRQLTRDSVTHSSPAFRANNNNCGESEEEEDEEEDAPSFMPNLFGGLQFKITKAGVSENGEPELVVSMEINNVTYEGSLFAAATKKNLKAHKLSHKLGTSPLSTSSPVKSTTSSAGSAVTTQMISPVDKQNTSNGSSQHHHHHNNNDTDMMNNNCVSKNPHFLEPEVQIHSPPSPPAKSQGAVPQIAPRIGQKGGEDSSFDEATSGRMDDQEEEEDEEAEKQMQNHRDMVEEDLSMKSSKKMMDEMRVVTSQPMVSSWSGGGEE